ncbi:MAG: hypothetical protein ACI9QD_001097 [Thermoproteota archaeon]|jgi:hypothetical protein
MRSKILTLVMSLLISLQVFAATPEEKGLEIARTVEKAGKGYKGEQSTLIMILINAHGDKIERRMESKTLEVDADGDKSIMEFKWPADVKGTKMLTWTHKTKSDDQWLYLPALRRVKRISSRSKSGSFMGSEFSYEDLGSQEVEKFKYKHIKDVKLEKEDHWVIERYPTDRKSGYSKQVVWLNKDKKNTSKMEYYDRKGDLLKTAIFSKNKKFGAYWRAMMINMQNHQTQKKSILEWKNRKLNVKFSSSQFRKSKLK